MLLTDYKNIKMGSSDISKIYQGDVQVWPKKEEKTVVSFTIVSGDTWDNASISAYTADGELIEPSIKDSTGWTYDAEVAYFMTATDEKTEQNLLTFNGINRRTDFKNQTRLFDLARSMTTADLSNVKPVGNDYGRIFRDCQKLTSADLSTWDMADATSTLNMFINCYAITGINMGNTFGRNGKITEMQGMFAYCKALTDLDLSGMNVTSCTNMNNLFTGCEALETLDLSGWEVQNAKSSGAVFSLCKSLKTVRMRGSSSESIAIVKSWLSAAGLSSVTVVTEDTPTGSTVAFTVSGTSTRSEVEYTTDGTNYQTVGVTNGEFKIDVGSDKTYFALTYGTEGKNMNANITSVALTGDTSNLTDSSYMFADCNGLNSINISKLNTSNVTDMSVMFLNCASLPSLSISRFDTSKVTDMKGMFYGCKALKLLYAAFIDTSNVTDMSMMFEDCGNLSSLNLIYFNTSNVKYMEEMFSGCSGLTSLDLSNFILSDSTTTNSMFYGCTSLKTIKIKDEASANKLIAQIKTDLSKTATWDSSTYTITIP